MDSVSKQKRSEIMRAVKSAGNRSTELKLIQLFKENKISGWRRNSRLPGKPDFVFPKLKIAVFADGCFWHGHNCRNVKPSANAAYWTKKIEGNKARDKRANRLLKASGWTLVRIWECHIKNGQIKKLVKQYSKDRK